MKGAQHLEAVGVRHENWVDDRVQEVARHVPK